MKLIDVIFECNELCFHDVAVTTDPSEMKQQGFQGDIPLALPNESVGLEGSGL